MLAERRDKDLDEWLGQAEHCGIAELKSEALGIRRDYTPFVPPFLLGGVTAMWKRRLTIA